MPGPGDGSAPGGDARPKQGAAAVAPPARQKVKAGALLRELGPGQSPALLRELHIVTRGGELNADALRKLKQINHLLRLLAPGIEGLLQKHEAPVLVDAGAGNAWLGLLVHEALLRPAGRGKVVAIERRADLVERSQTRAQHLGMTGFEAVHASVADLTPVAGAKSTLGDVHAVLALHACDRATDEAIVLGVRSGAELIAVVPCCQAEAAACLEGHAVDGTLAPMWRHPLHRRELGAHLTNVIRGLLLEAHGYRVRITELVGWEHSLKNELIVAERHQRQNGLALAQLRRLLAGLPPLPLWILGELMPTRPADESTPGASLPVGVDASGELGDAGIAAASSGG